ncbi:MAG: N-acetyltransferase family protein [Paracoccaceae bacterium]
MIIRPACPDDYEALLAIWNPVIRDTTIIFHSQERDPAMLDELITSRRAAGHEFFVAEAEGATEVGGTAPGAIMGFASYAQFRPGNGYATAMEHSIVLADGARGKGAGRALMQRLEGHAAAAGAHTLFAGVSGENSAGIAFHQAIGFQTVATIPEAGRKFGRWLDLVLMMKFL